MLGFRVSLVLIHQAHQSSLEHLRSYAEIWGYLCSAQPKISRSSVLRSIQQQLMQLASKATSNNSAGSCGDCGVTQACMVDVHVLQLLCPRCGWAHYGQLCICALRSVLAGLDYRRMLGFCVRPCLPEGEACSRPVAKCPTHSCPSCFRAIEEALETLTFNNDRWAQIAALRDFVFERLCVMVRKWNITRNRFTIHSNNISIATCQSADSD